MFLLISYIILATASFDVVHSSPKLDPELRLIGAEFAEETEFPWMVSLQYDKADNNTFKHSCAGSIVHKQYVVTAAHCVWNKTSNRLHILAGTIHNKINEEDTGHQRINVSRIFLHPKYQSQNRVGAYDIAVLKLNSDLLFNDNVKAIDLPEYGQQASGECTTLGWGNTFMITNLYYAGSDELRKISSSVINWNICWAAYGFVLGTPLETAICTSAGPLKGSCQGDSGGPLICYKDDNKSPYLAGIVSWGFIFCGDWFHPDVSTDVSRLRGFIDSIIS